MNVFKRKINWWGVLSTGVLLIWTLIQLFDWMSDNKNRISAIIVENQYYLPIDVIDKFNENSFYHESSILRDSLIAKDYVTDKFGVIQTIESYLEENYSHDFFKESFRDFHQIEIDISCRSKDGAKNLSIDTESEGFFQIISQDDNIISGTYNHNIKLEDIRPENSLKVIIWTSHYYSSDKFKINYDGGYIIPEESLNLSGIYVWLYHKRFVIQSIVMILIFLSIMFLLLYLYYSYEDKKKKKLKEEKKLKKKLNKENEKKNSKKKNKSEQKD